MTALQFTRHLYKTLWTYIISKKEFDDYFRNDEEGNYSPEDFYADSIPDLVTSLKNGFPFYEVYQNVIGSINDLAERNLIIEFMIWFKKNENTTGHSIIHDFMSEGLQISALNNLIKYVETKPLPDISENVKEKGDGKMNIIFSVLEKFTSASKSLTERRRGKTTLEIEDEYDMQDILHVILKPFFPALKLEEVISGNDSEKFLKIDFLISSIKVGIECKCIRDKAHANVITKEINDDIQTYHKHQDCNNLIIFIYDKKLLITNPDVLEQQYSKTQSFADKKLEINLLIRPKN